MAEGRTITTCGQALREAQWGVAVWLMRVRLMRVMGMVGMRSPPDGGIGGPLIVKAKRICRLVARLKVCKHSSH